MATSRAIIVAKLDAMLARFLANPRNWTKGSYSRELYNEEGLVIINPRTKRPEMAYCLIGAAKAAGNGLQLYWELAWTIEGDKLKTSTASSSPQLFKNRVEDKVTNFNDRASTDYEAIKSVIKRTRARIQRRGLLKLPKPRPRSSLEF